MIAIKILTAALSFDTSRQVRSPPGNKKVIKQESTDEVDAKALISFCAFL